MQENSDVIYCLVDSDSLVHVVDSWNPSPNHTPTEVDATQEGVCIHSANFSNNRISCLWVNHNTMSHASHHFDSFIISVDYRVSRYVLTINEEQDLDLNTSLFIMHGRRSASEPLNHTDCLVVNANCNILTSCTQLTMLRVWRNMSQPLLWPLIEWTPCSTVASHDTNYYSYTVGTWVLLWSSLFFVLISRYYYANCLASNGCRGYVLLFMVKASTSKWWMVSGELCVSVCVCVCVCACVCVSVCVCVCVSYYHGPMTTDSSCSASHVTVRISCGNHFCLCGQC